MKKALFLIFLVLIPSVLTISMSQNEIYNYQNREIKLLGIQESKILISIDGEKNIVSLNQQEEINGIKITLNEIFYSGELSTVDIDIESSYSCGDGFCDDFESYESCCQDCGCNPSTTDKCVDKECIIPECNKDSDCNDNNPLTENLCEDYKCKFKRIRCENNLDCDDSDPDTDDSCDNGKCINILNYVCKTDIDCDDSNPCTVESCINKDCFYTDLENCEHTPPEKEEPKPELYTEEKQKGFLSRFFSWLFSIF